MRVLIDACVLYPTVLREIVAGCAGAGLFEPLWSARILEEWARAAARLGAADAAVARGEVAALRAAFPAAEVPPAPEIEARLALPDPGDVHVLAAAIAGGADTLLTLNLKDFPTRRLTAEGVIRRDPDGFLRELWQEAPGTVWRVVGGVHATACGLAGEALDRRRLLKRAGLPRLARALDQNGISSSMSS